MPHNAMKSFWGDSPDQNSLVNPEISNFAYKIQRGKTPSSDQGHAPRHVRDEDKNLTERGDVERDDGQDVRKRVLGGWITRSRRRGEE